MDPPTDNDDDDGQASAAEFQKKFDTIEAEARRKRQGDNFDATTSDEEDMYDAESPKKSSKNRTESSENDDDSSRSTDSASPNIVRVDPPAPRPKDGYEDEDSDDSPAAMAAGIAESARNNMNVAPRTLELLPSNANEDVSPLTSAAATTPSVATRGSNKKSPFVMSASRKANPKKDKEKSVKVRMQINRRVKTTREKLYQKQHSPHKWRQR